jgi:hypothetical protein
MNDFDRHLSERDSQRYESTRILNPISSAS